VARIVLVADDSPTIQKRALGILKGEGFEVETVSNGVAAIKRLAVINPVVILADVSMPGRDGYEVCEFVKKSADLSHVPVLLVASDMEPYDEARGEEVGADGIIKKPFEAQELISIVVKFAEQFEAATHPVASPGAPSAARESTQEFAFSVEDLDEAPTVVEQVTPDISAASEELTSAAPAVEAPPGPSIETHPAEMEVPYPARSTEDLAEAPTVVEHVTPDISAASEEVTSAAPAVEASPGPSIESQPAEMEVAYPAPQAETEVALDLPAAPEFVDTISAPESPIAPAAETPLVVEEPPVPSSLEPPPPPPPAQAPSFLEGLEEAATPEPVFIEEPPEQTSGPPESADEFQTVIFRAPLDIAEPVWTDETVAAPPAHEPAGPTELEPQLEAEAPVASPEIPAEQPPEAAHIAPSMAATSLDSFSLEDATAGQVHFAPQTAEVAPVEVAPEEFAPEEVISVEVAPGEVTPEEVALEEVTLVEVTPGEVGLEEVSPVEVAPEEVVLEEVTPVEPPPGEVAPEEVAPLEAAAVEVAQVGVAAAEVAYSAPAEEAPPTEIAPPAPAPEAATTEIASQDAATDAALAEPLAEVGTPLPAFDWGLIYSVVHKVVLRMAPPALPMEVVEDLARRIAEDIVTEIVNESSQPPA